MSGYQSLTPSSPTSPMPSSTRSNFSRSNHEHTNVDIGTLESRGSVADSVSQRFAMAPSPKAWGTPLDIHTTEPDDYLHNPDPLRDRNIDRGGSICTARGLENLGCLFVLVAGCLMLLKGYPILTHFMRKPIPTQGGFNVGGINATGQIPLMTGNYALIDRATPKSAYTKPSYANPNEEMVLVFSDEFEQDGRSFYPGDDPFWEAVDLHYWGTNDLEWYDPMQATTKGGALRLTIAKVDPESNHNLTYRSAMIQSWNKFCFTGGLIEAAVTLPGDNKASGLWPALWAMGNLGRAGYGASLDGLWPYSYDSCDVGTLPNQTYPGTATPIAATENGDPSHDNVLSYLPGQRLSACTCAGESHPGPARRDGSYVGRSAPEIDIFEATVESDGGKVSLSAQWAPYNAAYTWKNSSDNLVIVDTVHKTQLNTYKGGVYQQTTSGLALTNQDCYELGGGCFSVYGFEYSPGFDNAYITWINDGQQAWLLHAAGMGPDSATEISARPVPQEPMYIIANLGFSMNFAALDLDALVFPATMSIDYIRVYQPKDNINIGCDPHNFPTKSYIDTYKEVYTNPNISTWEQAGQPWPKNKLLNGGKC
ncbi:beta-glucan synthesis-associated protein SKN1 [Agrocybe pediades]|nr:beta-glucan synthesis-associated protein SKN1 [Agrocybe pediades]